jgi:type VI secretion system secreted protein Hcp
MFSKIKSLVFFQHTVSVQKVRGTDKSFSKGTEMKTTQKTANMLMTVLAIAGLFWLLSLATAGKLEPSSAPGPSMHSLDEIYDAYSSIGQVPDFHPEVPKGTTQIFIKFDGIDGEVNVNPHSGWSNVACLNQGHLLTGGENTEGTRQRGDVTLEDMTLVKPMDKATPKIAEAICKGTIIPTVMIHMAGTFGANEIIYYNCELTNVLVTGYSLDAEGQKDHVPMEKITIAFEKIRATYTEVDKDGEVKGETGYEWMTVQNPN